jgi:hypothetical protein
MATSYSYTIPQLLSIKTANANTFAVPPIGLVKIILNGTPANTTSTKREPRRRQQDWNRSQQQHHQQQHSQQQVLSQSENSFSVARKRKKDKSQSELLMGEIRSLLNKVTKENYDAVQNELSAQDSKLYGYANALEERDRDEFLTDISKLFVKKAQIDHEFGALYAGLAKTLTQQVEVFGDILYEVCRETIPISKYEPDCKKNYVGALLLLIEMRRHEIINNNNICATFDRLMSTIDRCDPNTVYSVQTEGEIPVNPMEQTELCVEIICKVLPQYMQVEQPEWVNIYLAKLQQLQQQKERLKPRSRFMLSDFFKIASGQ